MPALAVEEFYSLLMSQTWLLVNERVVSIRSGLACIEWQNQEY